MGYAIKQGSSQAAPFVTGVAALILQSNPNFSPQNVYDALSRTSLQKIITGDPSGPKNLIQAYQVPQPNTPAYNSALVTLSDPSSIPPDGIAQPFTLPWYQTLGFIIGITLVGVSSIIAVVLIWWCRKRKSQKVSQIGQNVDTVKGDLGHDRDSQHQNQSPMYQTYIASGPQVQRQPTPSVMTSNNLRSELRYHGSVNG